MAVPSYLGEEIELPTTVFDANFGETFECPIEAYTKDDGALVLNQRGANVVYLYPEQAEALRRALNLRHYAKQVAAAVGLEV